MKRTFYIVFILFSYIGMAQNNALFEQGKQQYKSEKFQEAINNWMKIVRAGEHSSALYYNIANAHYKLNSIGPSIYYYEKALQFAPNDNETLNNLTFAQNATVDAIEPLPKTIFAKWDTTLSSWLTFNGWAWVTVICAVLFALLLLLYYFSVYSVKKRLFFAGAILMFLLIIIGLTMSYRNYHKQVKDQPAIIFAESSNIKSDPSQKSETSFILHEGTKVQIIAEDDDWYRILLADGKDGWIHQKDLKPL